MMRILVCVTRWSRWCVCAMLLFPSMPKHWNSSSCSQIFHSIFFLLAANSRRIRIFMYWHKDWKQLKSHFIHSKIIADEFYETFKSWWWSAWCVSRVIDVQPAENQVFNYLNSATHLNSSFPLEYLHSLRKKYVTQYLQMRHKAIQNVK